MNHYYPKQSQPGRKAYFYADVTFFAIPAKETKTFTAGQPVTDVAQVNCIVPFFNMTSFCCAI